MFNGIGRRLQTHKTTNLGMEQHKKTKNLALKD